MWITIQYLIDNTVANISGSIKLSHHIFLHPFPVFYSTTILQLKALFSDPPIVLLINRIYINHEINLNFRIVPKFSYNCLLVQSAIYYSLCIVPFDATYVFASATSSFFKWINKYTFFIFLQHTMIQLFSNIIFPNPYYVALLWQKLALLITAADKFEDYFWRSCLLMAECIIFAWEISISLEFSFEI
jgi:hypothetical protein